MIPDRDRACDRLGPELVDAAHQRLTYFTRGAEWSDRDVRREAARYALAAMTARGPVTDWIIDDTGFPKQGTHSVGVQRQYSGTIGKIGNCQVAASLTIATRTEHVPVDFALYLPQSWTDNPARRAEAHIPKEVTFKTKPELGLEMIERAVADGLPTGLVLADSAYGDNTEFRRRVRCEGLDYAVGLHCTTTVGATCRTPSTSLSAATPCRACPSSPPQAGPRTKPDSSAPNRLARGRSFPSGNPGSARFRRLVAIHANLPHAWSRRNHPACKGFTPRARIHALVCSSSKSNEVDFLRVLTGGVVATFRGVGPSPPTMSTRAKLHNSAVGLSASHGGAFWCSSGNRLPNGEIPSLAISLDPQARARNPGQARACRLQLSLVMCLLTCSGVLAVVALAADRTSECEVQSGPEAAGCLIGNREGRKASGTPTADFGTYPTLPDDSSPPPTRLPGAAHVELAIEPALGS